ncbi:MAG: TIGR04283 family arsenosugar biosynthesis glycosyltransferase [Deltaproteobacteria bacterium]
MPRVSVIVPALDEASLIGRTLGRINRDDNVEMIVVDGGSRDRTPEVARGLGATVVRSRRGRAPQMNRGAEKAAGEILLFLHADTLLPEGWIDRVREISAWPNTAGGAFELRLDTTLRWSRLIERLANLRSRVLQMPYGDQAIFISADLFRRMGGYKDLPIMEDFEFVRRLRRQGQVRIVPFPVTTSARRWKHLGMWRTTLVNQAIVLAYLLGLSPNLMKRLYRMKSGDS